ncbi:aminopeptidase P family protein [Candidatus Falkowbacteria bacterium]|nr:aminopeptidase P family protein [Candidatus Falkowbacteria bacterium]
MWNQEKITDHAQAARLLCQIKDSSFSLIASRRDVSEYEVQQHIVEQFVRNGLVTDRDSAIVAFDTNTSFVHYYPTKECKQLEPESLIMIDLWARLDKDDAPFADITWMAYYGDSPASEIAAVYVLVIKARDAGLKLIRRNLKKGQMPTGKMVDDEVRKVIATAGYGDKFLHTTGHSLGFDSPHGKEFGLNWKSERPLIKNLAYTIEPGVYLENRFGVRSEIDFYIDDKLELIITTDVQKELVMI